MFAALYGTGIRPGDRFFCPSSPAWGHGLWHGTLAPLALGVKTGIFAGRFDAERLMRALQDFATTNLSAAATHYRMMKNSGAASRFATPCKMSFTGEPIDATPGVHRTHFRRPLCSMYGTTEIGVVLVNYPGADDFASSRARWASRCPASRSRCNGPTARRAHPGDIGEIKVWRRDGWFPTKDRGGSTRTAISTMRAARTT